MPVVQDSPRSYVDWPSPYSRSGWADIIGEVRPKATGSGSPTLATYRSSISQYKMAVNDLDWCAYHIPHDYVPGTDLYIHAHWSHIATNVTTGGVTFEFQTSYAKGHNQGAFSAPKTVTVTQAASTTQYQHMIAEVAFTSAAGSASLIANSLIEIDGLLLVQFKLTANTMSAATDPFVHFIDVHYETNGVIGSLNKAPNFYS